jgi:hypothetical protein
LHSICCNCRHGARVLWLLLLARPLAPVSGQTWYSALVQIDAQGKLIYAHDAEGNRIPDFGYAGYRNGTVPLPDVPVVKTISPVAGDNTQQIQDALNEVAALQPDADGFRGALLLAAGNYRVAGTISVNASGVVLRGVGEGDDSTTNTVIIGTGDTPHQRTVIVAGGGSQTKWSQQVAGTKTNITSDTIFVGDRTFAVQDASPYHVGDNIVIYHPCTDAWLQAVDSGGTATDAGWTVGEQPIVYNRTVTAVAGNVLTIDAPVFNTLIRSLSQSYVYRYARTGLRTGIGIENLRVFIEAPGVTTDASGDENHAWDAILIVQAEDCWVRHCTALHFGQSGFKTATATRVTIDSCSALDPISIITGERRYNFNVYTASQLILFNGCRSTYGRHDFVSNGTSWVSGCVFVDCVSEHAYSSTEGHRRWSQGLLYDNIVYRNPSISAYLLGLYNRGDYGTGHGWAAVHSVAWNCDAGTNAIVIQKPPTAQNYAVGCMASTVTGLRPVAPFSCPEGYIEGTNVDGLVPRSLYYAQLQERLLTTGFGELEGELRERPRVCRLDQNYPNPFNPSTAIRFQTVDSRWVTLGVYDMLGREVSVLFRGKQPPGSRTVRFDGANLSSGVYLCRFQILADDGTLEYQDVKRMLLLR